MNPNAPTDAPPPRPLTRFVRVLLVLIGVNCMIVSVLGLTGALAAGVFGGVGRIVAGAAALLVGAIGVASITSAMAGRWTGVWKWIDARLRAFTRGAPS